MRRRLLMAVAIALLLASGMAIAAPVVAPRDINPCASLTPDDTFLWWFFGCGNDAAGGGASGAA